MIGFIFDKLFGCYFNCYGGYIENGKFICGRCGKKIDGLRYLGRRRGMMDWISVKDRLPNDDRRVLGTDGEKHEIVCCINSDFEWVSATGDYGNFTSIKWVTYWMPLPERPKNDKSN